MPLTSSERETNASYKISTATKRNANGPKECRGVELSGISTSTARAAYLYL